MAILSQLQSALEQSVLQKEIGDYDLLPQPAGKSLDRSTKLPNNGFLSFSAEGSLKVALSVVNNTDDLSLNHNSIFLGKSLELSDDEEADDSGLPPVIHFNPDYAWLRIALTTEGSGTLSLNAQSLGLTLGGKLESQFSFAYFHREDPGKTLGAAITNLAQSFLQHNPTDPQTALPEGSGIACSLHTEMQATAAIDLGVFLQPVLATIMRTGPSRFLFSSLGIKAPLSVDFKVKGGFLIEIGRLPAESVTLPGHIGYRTAVKKCDSRGWEVGIDATLGAEVRQIADEIKKRLEDALGLEPFLGKLENLLNEGESKRDEISAILGKLNLAFPSGSDPIENARSLIETVNNIPQSITPQRISLSIARSYSQLWESDVLYQFKSYLAPDQTWDKNIIRQLTTLNIPELHKAVSAQSATRRTTPELYSERESRSSSHQSGVSLAIGPFSFGNQHKQSLRWTTLNNVFPHNDTRSAFEVSRNRTHHLGRRQAHHQYALSGSPRTRSNTFDAIDYHLELSWCSDDDDSPTRTLRKQDIRELVDLLWISKGDDTGSEDQESFQTSLLNNLGEQEAFDQAGSAYLSLIWDFTPENPSQPHPLIHFAQKFQTAANPAVGENQALARAMAHAVTPVMGRSHRQTALARETTLQSLFTLYLDTPSYSDRKAKSLLVARGRELERSPDSFEKSWGNSLLTHDATPRVRSRGPRRNHPALNAISTNYHPNQPLAVIQDIDPAAMLKQTAAAWSSLATMIQNRHELQEDTFNELQKGLFLPARQSHPYDRYAFRLLIAVLGPLDIPYELSAGVQLADGQSLEIFSA